MTVPSPSAPGLPDPLIEMREVTAAYDRIRVLHGIDLAASPGEFLTLLGPNGAGKTTTLKVLAGQLPATSGCVHVAGHHLNGVAAGAFAKMGVCLIPEGRGIFPNLTVWDNLKVFSNSGTPHREIAERSFERFPRLGERRNQLAGTLSGGEQQMLALARGLGTNPAILLLDELSMGLAPIIVKQLYALVAEIAADGVTVIAVEQFARLVLDVADRAAIIGAGRVTFVGDPVEAAARLHDAYLGSGQAVPA